ELAVTNADGPPRLDELAVGRELADAARRAVLEPLGNGGGRRHSLGIVSVSHEDAAVRPDDDVVGLVELAIGVASFAGDAETQDLLALRAELVDLVPLGARLVAGEVGHPHVAVLVYRDAVRRHHHALAEVGQDGARVAVELEDRIDRVDVAIDRAATCTGGRGSAAALVGPDVAVARIDVDTG